MISTTNIYQEWLKTDEPGRPEAIKRIAAGFSQMPKDKQTLDEARKKLRPAVRAVSYFDPAQLKKMGSGSAAETTTIPYKRIGDGAAVAIAIDGQDSMAIATNKDLEDWKITIDQALAIAVANLGVDAKFEQLEPGVWAAQMHDSYDASRIMLVEDIDKLGLAGGAVALIPNRETLLLAGKTDAKALMRIARSGRGGVEGSAADPHAGAVPRRRRVARLPAEHHAAREAAVRVARGAGLDRSLRRRPRRVSGRARRRSVRRAPHRDEQAGRCDHHLRDVDEDRSDDAAEGGLHRVRHPRGARRAGEGPPARAGRGAASWRWPAIA